MKGFAVFAKILRARHEFAHVFENRLRSLGHLIPGTLESGNGCRSQRGNNRG